MSTSSSSTSSTTHVRDNEIQTLSSPHDATKNHPWITVTTQSITTTYLDACLGKVGTAWNALVVEINIAIVTIAVYWFIVTTCSLLFSVLTRYSNHCICVYLYIYIFLF